MRGNSSQGAVSGVALEILERGKRGESDKEELMYSENTQLTTNIELAKAEAEVDEARAEAAEKAYKDAA